MYDIIKEYDRKIDAMCDVAKVMFGSAGPASLRGIMNAVWTTP